MLELDGSGNEIAFNVYAGNTLLCRKVDGEVLYYIYNGHGDVTGLTNSNGSLAASYYYDAFGNITEQTGNKNNSTAYAGYQYDEETGLYYLVSRMYDPKIARFMQEDTYRGDAKDPLSLNLYTYCKNEPLRYWDPTGHVVTEWDLMNCSPEQIEAIVAATDAWNAAKAAGDVEAMAAAHAAAEAARGYATSGDGTVAEVPGGTTSVYLDDNDLSALLNAYIAQEYKDFISREPKDSSVILSDTGIEKYSSGFLNDFFEDLTESGAIDWLLYLTIGAERDENNIFHIRQDWWQSWKYAGYNDFYDAVFDMFAEMDSDQFPFTYDNEQFIIWAWKGDYINLGAGAELGIYYGGGPHWLTGTGYAMSMTLKLMDVSGNEIFYWAPDEDNWWITGFDPSEQGFLANELVAVYTLDFSENEKMRGMYGAFYDAWYGVDDRWTFDTENYKITYEFISEEIL